MFVMRFQICKKSSIEAILWSKNKWVKKICVGWRSALREKVAMVSHTLQQREKLQPPSHRTSDVFDPTHQPSLSPNINQSFEGSIESEHSWPCCCNDLLFCETHFAIAKANEAQTVNISRLELSSYNYPMI